MRQKEAWDIYLSSNHFSLVTIPSCWRRESCRLSNLSCRRSSKSFTLRGAWGFTGVSPTTPFVFYGPVGGIWLHPLGFIWGTFQVYQVRGPLLWAIWSLYKQFRSLVSIGEVRPDSVPFWTLTVLPFVIGLVQELYGLDFYISQGPDGSGLGPVDFVPAFSPWLDSAFSLLPRPT